MTTSLTVALDVVLDTAIVVGILSVLRWGMRAQIRDMKAMELAERRLGGDGRQTARPVRTHAEQRHEQRRESGPLTA